jgi:hypothetical protein
MPWRVTLVCVSEYPRRFVQRRTPTGPTAIPWLHRLAIRVAQGHREGTELPSRFEVITSRPRSHAMPTEAQGLDDPKLP